MKEYRLSYSYDAATIHYHDAEIGWILCNKTIGSLFCGSLVVLYDSSPSYPMPEKCLRAVLAAGVTPSSAGLRYYTEL